MLENKAEEKTLKPYVTRLGAFALAVGTAIGWGSLVVTNSNYLLNAGPVGSVIGMIIGAAIMLIMARNYFYMINCYPEAGGIYSYIKNVFGYDRAFLISWFVSLTYMAMLWANATSVPLFVRYFIGDIFQFGELYTLFGYKVYLGEILITLAVFITIGYICMRFKKAAMNLLIGTVLVFTAGIIVTFIGSFLKGAAAGGFDPAFIPDTGVLRQVITITFITPWAFVGFENISHSAEEFSFQKEKVMGIFRTAILVTTLLYALVLLMSVTAYPEEYGSWLDYIRDLGNLSGIKALPAFYVAYRYLGSAGVHIMMFALAGLVLSSLIGNTISLSRMFYALSRDKILPSKFTALSHDGIPYKAVMLVMLVSLPVPLLGRTAIGWIVDVTTVGAILLYGFVSAAAWVKAKREDDKGKALFGLVGLVIMVIFGIYVVVTSTFGDGAMGRESQMIFIIWSVIGLFYFRFVMVRDHGKRFGKNLTVWIVLVAFIFVLTMIWICEECAQISTANILAIRNDYAAEAVENLEDDPKLAQYLRNFMVMIMGSAAGVFAIFTVSLGAMLSNWNYVRKCEEETNLELGKVRTIAYNDPLTGVKSKHAFVEYEAEINDAIEEGKQEPFALLVCDVNGLKHINDTLGHKAGDQYIKDGGTLISEQFKRSPVFRTGGDEFVVLMNGHDYPEREELVAEFNRKVEQNLKDGKVVVSAGLADFDPENDHGFHAVFERADKLMYERKMELKSMGAITRE
ncbi:MAG: amino acid permease [Eubacterium sp.]|nr:amino acid permease [Eubacterium sp.]